jgi:hypothetical protein
LGCQWHLQEKGQTVTSVYKFNIHGSVHRSMI